MEGLKQAGGQLVQRETPFLAPGLHAIHSYVLAVKSLKKNHFFLFFFLSLFKKSALMGSAGGRDAQDSFSLLSDNFSPCERTSPSSRKC